MEFDKYLEFYRGFGPVLKEGLARDWTNREKIADLLREGQHRAGSSRPEEYVAKMPEGQTEIYYLIGDSSGTTPPLAVSRGVPCEGPRRALARRSHR